MTRANGNFDFLRRECVVGTALRVERTYVGGQFASGEGVTLDYSLKLAYALLSWIENLTFGGKIIGGGGSSNSATLKGWLSRSVGYN